VVNWVKTAMKEPYSSQPFNWTRYGRCVGSDPVLRLSTFDILSERGRLGRDPANSVTRLGPHRPRSIILGIPRPQAVAGDHVDSLGLNPALTSTITFNRTPRHRRLSQPAKISQADLDRFYESIVQEVQDRGGICAITSGMACVKYGVAQSTKDCDVLCDEVGVDLMRAVIAKATLRGATAAYRGHITPPLDHRWLAGGWTSHFIWESLPVVPQLDVFSVAPRASSNWTDAVDGLFVEMQIVAEMKRTDRAKDWPFCDSLGVKLIDSGELTGWLHIFEAATLEELASGVPLPDDLLERRPALRLIGIDHFDLRKALMVEQTFWQELDRVRIRIHQDFIRKYMHAVKHDPRVKNSPLDVQHQLRIEHALEWLPQCPILDFGIATLIDEAKMATQRLHSKEWMKFLPDATKHFCGLKRISLS